MSKKIKISSIIKNEENPRWIDKVNFEKLVNSILLFPKMMELRPMVLGPDNKPLAGNMRKKAIDEIQKRLIAVNLTEQQAVSVANNRGIFDLIYKGYIPNNWVKYAEGLTEEQLREFVIKDNISFGSWDWEMLSNQYEEEELSEWGLVPIIEQEEEEEKQQEDIPEQTLVIKLHYTSEEYDMVKQAIADKGQTAESILFSALGLEENIF